ncbi:non-ribosomal peptide synthetase [Nostoc sp. UHCC 0251]|uniref:non-ribosomal peptide synthetase n=1 Tax=Nostoc sp. UHCC 0251 TaxID=3110240 RepID=UPI002B1F7338|nr:non-ribosomal peptide synthetase [Nostoc sp. UHCC 0251]MEA5627146.1 amino acid adenylation domain-containing protein [Nostoc sp. UHCC 0251]
MNKYFDNLVELLRYRAVNQSDKQAFTFLVNGQQETNFTYQQLDLKARAIAVSLKNITTTGERVLLIYPPGLEFIAAFFGCLYAGVIAVPAYPPRQNKSLSRLQSVVADAEATLAFTTTTALSNIQGQLTDLTNLQSLHWLTTDNINTDLANSWQQSQINSDSLAFLQYTSGSTGMPKGVMVSHGNLLQNLASIHQCFGHSPHSQGVIWLPPYHDMGLIGGILQPLYGGFPVTLMSPVDFLQKPFQWLEAISRYKATTSGGPNFAYDLCVRKITPEQRKTLDLSSWEVAFNGAEPIRAETLTKFAETFASCGFRTSSFYPCYGMAETTLIVAGGVKTNPPTLTSIDGKALLENRVTPASVKNNYAQTFVSSGQNIENHEIVIVHPETLQGCSDDEVGEIWVRGASVTQGYWRKPEETQATFSAYLADTKAGPFLRTGDLGFLQSRELFVTGRLKDLIIVRGRNYYPQDIELTVEKSHHALKSSSSAAFSVDINGQEQLVIACEVEREYLRKLDGDAIAKNILKAVGEEHELQVHTVLLLKTGSIPKTSSGKIRRRACRAGFIAGDLNIVWDWSKNPENKSEFRNLLADVDYLKQQIEGKRQEKEVIRPQLDNIRVKLRNIVANLLQVDFAEVDIHQSLMAMGADSLVLAEAAEAVENLFGINIELRQLFEELTTLDALANYINQNHSLEANLRGTNHIDATAATRRVGREVGEEREEVTSLLSEAQKQLWVLAQIGDDGSLAYNVSATAELKGEFQLEAMRQAMQKLVNRHEALRTGISSEGDFQYILPNLEVEIPLINFCYLNEEERQSQVDKWFKKESLKAFDLGKAPLFRFHILKLTEKHHLLMFTAHHIIVDGWSMGIILQELAALYSAECQNFDTRLKSPMQLTEYIKWQEQQSQTPEMKVHESYWLEKFQAATPILDLPTDRPRPLIKSYKGSRQTIQLDANLSRRIKNFSRENSCTLFMTLLSVYTTLLHRLTGQEDIVVGVPAAGRFKGSERLVGYCSHLLPIRSYIDDNVTFLQHLQTTKTELLNAYEHQDYPFASLIEKLKISRNTSLSPLVTAIFNLNRPLAVPKMFGVETSLLPQSVSFVDHDICFNVSEIDGELILDCDYNTDVFDNSTINRILVIFQTLLEKAVNNPEQSLGNLHLLNEFQQHKMLVEWNNTNKKYPQNQCIHELFEAQVEKTPNAVAVVFGEQKLTYQELNNRANQLAHHLQTLGVKPEVLVGICVERSLEMMVGMLGILKAGGAYVPLDSSYPQERLNYILSDSSVSILLTTENLLAQLPTYEAKVICLDTQWEEISSHSQANLESDVQPSNLGYVIYTSGSTGKPKGVLVTHRNLVNHSSAIARQFHLTSQDKVLQFAALSFDVAIEEIFPSWLSGATVVLRPQQMFASFADFVEFINAQSLTVLNLPAAFWHEWVLHLSQSPEFFPRCLRLVVVGSEQVRWERVSMWQKYVGSHVKLLNAYGPTEATITATVYEPDLRKLENQTGGVPIGRPIDNTQVYILDRNLQPVPVGVVGELYIAGAGVARGYLNRPELTQEKFITNPFGNSKLYKTGDLARYLRDGNIDFIGRIDNQVKIRGFRIELGEIESVLNTHPQIKQAIVIAREDNPGSKRLVAYIVANSDTLNIQQLHSELKQKLPNYMLPSAFVTLDALPLTPNGKVDRKALPAPDKNTEIDVVSPTTSTQEILAKIWAEVLGVEQVSIYDNFFELGGDSILSIQVVTRANAEGLVLTPKQLFQHQTIADLSTVVTTNTTITTEQGVVTGTVPLTPIQHWFFEQNLPNPSHYNQSVMLEVSPNLNSELLEQVLQQLLIHHDALRLRFTLDADNVTQFNAEYDETQVFTCVDLSELSPNEQQSALKSTADEMQTQLNLSEGSLMRAILFRLGSNQPGRLLLIVHHLAVDGVSWRIVLEDLFTAYQQLNHGSAIQLPAKTTSFKYWANRLSEYAVSPALATELDYWLTQSACNISPLPVDYIAGKEKNTVVSAEQVSVSLSVEQTQALLQDVPSTYNTHINDVLLTALTQTFTDWTGDNSLLVDLEGHGREELFEDVDLSRTVGWFTSVFPVKLQLNHHLQGEALKLIKEQLRQIPNRGIGYGVLQYLSQDKAIAKQLQSLPQPQISFNYLGQLDTVRSQSMLLGFAKESSGLTHCPQGYRSHLLEIDSFVMDGKLQLNWTYSSSFHCRHTIERLAQMFIKTLESLIYHCVDVEVGSYTPSDFPEAGLNQQELELLLGKLSV